MEIFLRIGDRVKVTNTRSRFVEIMGTVSLIPESIDRVLIEFDESYGFTGRDGRDWFYPSELTKAKQQPHPDACHCNECEAIRFAYCGYED